MPKVAERFSRVVDRQVEYVQLPWNRFREAAGEEYTRMYQWFDRVGYEADIRALRAIYPQLTTLEQYLCSHSWEGAGGILERLPRGSVEAVPLSRKVTDLRDAYISAGIVSERWLGDATQGAAATIACADAIASWNFQHIVRLDKFRAYNQVNLANGYGIRQSLLHKRCARMTRSNLGKAFDCVEFKREAQTAIYELVKDFSAAEQLEFYRRHAESSPLGAWWKTVKAESEGGRLRG